MDTNKTNYDRSLLYNLTRGPVWIGQAISATASELKKKSKVRAEETALNKARQKFNEERPISKGSVGRESAERNRMKKRILRERSGIQGTPVVVPNAGLRMPSKKRMVDEGKMDLINY